LKKEFTQLPKTEQFLLQKIAETRTGRPVALERVPGLLPRGKLFVRGALEVEDIGRVRVKPERTFFGEFFQGTRRENIPSILREGLKPGRLKGFPEPGGEVFLTSSEKLAGKFASDPSGIIKVGLTKKQIESATKFGVTKLRGVRGEVISLPKTIPPRQIISPTQIELAPPRAAPGKRIRRFQRIAVVEEPREVGRFDVIRAESFFKDVTKPFARARGRVPRLKETVIELRRPIAVGPSDVQVFRPSLTARRTPLARTFEQQVLKAATRFAPPATPTRARTVSRVRPRVRPTTLIKTPQQLEDQVSRSSQLQFQISGVGQRQVPIQAGILRGRVRQRQVVSEKQIERQIQKITPKIIQRPRQRLPTRTALRARLRIPRIGGPGIPTFTPPITPPKTPPVIIPIGLPFGKGKRKRGFNGGRVKDDLAISEGFIARQLLLDPIKIKQADVSKLASQSARGFGIRRLPIIVR